MVNRTKLLQRMVSRQKNFPFSDALKIAGAFGFSLARVNGSHHILKRKEIPEFLNLQNVAGQAKP